MQAGNGTANTCRIDQWTDSLTEHDPSPLGGTQLPDCFPWGSVTAACDQVTLRMMEGLWAVYG